MKPNDLILQTVTKVATFIIITFAAYLFLAGHHDPGGGFVGGLVVASAIVLLYLAYDIKMVKEGFPIDFKTLAAVGVFISVATGLLSILLGKSFLSQSFGYFDLPFLGRTELATAVLFDIGVAVAVLGTSLTIISAISEDG